MMKSLKVKVIVPLLLLAVIGIVSSLMGLVSDIERNRIQRNNNRHSFRCNFIPCFPKLS